MSSISVVLITVALLLALATAQPTDSSQDQQLRALEPISDDELSNELDQLEQTGQLFNQKRAQSFCIRRGGNCDYRPNDCCFSSACRCNLWGTNCKCARMGLLQKWGRK